MQSKYRLKSSRTFEIVFKKGKRVSGNTLVLFYLNGKYPSVLKVGFSISKKVGKAVVRNKVKRRLKESFRSLIPSVKTGNTYVISAKPEAAERDYHQLKEELEHLITKAELWNNEKPC